jgi:hypothetical protein
MIAMGLNKVLTPPSLSWQLYQLLGDSGVTLKFLLIQDLNHFLTGFHHLIFRA